ncbi:chlorophyll a/b-binding protein [Lyngbya confervoides]|uniref:Chlorophyll a-b binding domain-containing protein n=1 Tax=Lyngbya confervoides BDU141951 TaxID=1574623 RepID=A0ABD4T724_9CYAN|nr:chlorophyll a/b-binding protein [Lyngbya confervoides]MCM1984253.1 chlorophyll a-b binding domain-containing protein [Lyngbya confervoides BDU141951]
MSELPVIPELSAQDSPLEPHDELATPSFGWNPYAEVINGRFAMLAILGLISIELFTGQDFFSWLGIR